MLYSYFRQIFLLHVSFFLLRFNSGWQWWCIRWYNRSRSNLCTDKEISGLYHLILMFFLSVTWESQIFVSILSSRCTIFALSFEFVYFINVNYHPSSDWWWIITDCVKIPVSNHIVWYRWRLIFAQIFMLYAWCTCSCVHLQYWMLYSPYSNCCCLVNNYLRNLTPLVS